MRWEFNDDLVRQQFGAMPPEGRRALVGLMDAVALVPFNFVEQSDPAYQGHAAPVKTLPFGAGGLVTFQVYEPGERVVVLQVLWLA